MAPYIRSLDRFFEDAAAGTLPHVVFVEPQFGGTDALRTDDHPYGDVGMGQRWVREVFGAFTRSPHWQRGAFILTYDEWGGFFDHVHPPLLADARASKNDANNFAQAGFRVPTLLASPYAQPGAVDHRALRPHVDHAVPGVAVPRRTRRRPRPYRAVVAHAARP